MIRALARSLFVAVLSLVSLSFPDIARGHLPRLRRNDPPIVPARPERARARRVTEQELPPALLTTPAYYGTLSAVRSLGRAGVTVTTAGPSPSISGWSKYTARHVSCPPTEDADAFLEWLLAFGRSHERHVLLPTCDDTAWLFSRYREELGQYFYLSSPPIDTVHALLNKQLLADHARRVGLAVPRTWYPDDESALPAVAREARFPVLIKPRTQVLFPARNKGLRVERADDLVPAYRAFARLPYGRPLVEYDQAVIRPMIQEFFPHASTGIYNIAGFVQQGRLLGARAGCKVLQRPRRLGVGVCFEESALDPDLAAGVERLTTRVGFDGVFEAEFVSTPQGNVIIDFNPRFYNQMEFDISRGLRLPALAYAGALPAELRASSNLQLLGRPESMAPGMPAPPGGRVFAYGAAFKVMIATQRWSGALSSEEADSWRRWYESHREMRVDAVHDPDDTWPALVDALQMLRHHVRHPRNFWHTIVLNR